MAKQQARIFQKHDTEANWKKNGTNFIPGPGEIIIYDKDEEHSIPRFKIGDGQQAINDLPFADSNLSDTVLYTPQTLTDEQQSQARVNIGAVSEEDVIDIIANGTEQQVNATGDLVEFNFEKEMPITVISKIHRDSTWELSNQLVLHQVKGNNFADFTSYLGGVGTVFSKNGLTATVNDNSTITVSGTNESTGWTNIIEKTWWEGEHSKKVYPAGTYTIPQGFILRVRAAQYPNNIVIEGLPNNLSGTQTIQEPFRIIGLIYSIGPSATVETTVPLGLFRGDFIPEVGYEYSGVLHTVTFDNSVYEGEFNWSTGELKKVGDDTLAYYDISEINSLPGTNYFWTGFGENIVSNRKTSEKVILRLGETAPEETISSICDFMFTPTTPEAAYGLYYAPFLPNGQFNGDEVPILTTKGVLSVKDKNENVKYSKYIEPIFNSRGVTDILSHKGLEKKWSEKFYLNKDPVSITHVPPPWDGMIDNYIFIWEFDENDFVNTGIPARIRDIPMASPCFINNESSKSRVEEYSEIWNSTPYPAFFSYNEETGKYILSAKGIRGNAISAQLTQYSKVYFYYQLETPYVEPFTFAMGINAGDKITFEADLTDNQPYIDAISDFQNKNVDPSLTVFIPCNVEEAMDGMINAAMILNMDSTTGGDSTVQGYSWIGEGDGVTDYTVQIQSKLDELHMVSNGGTVRLGPGIYPISKSLIIYENTQIIGDGHTVIEQRADNTHAIIWNGSYIRMKDLTIKLAGACTEITACIFANCNNTVNGNRDERYPENAYVQFCSTNNVSCIGTYEMSYDDNYKYLSEQALAYRGVGVVNRGLYFNYYDCDGLVCRNLYSGIYEGGGSNNYRIYVTESRFAVNGGGGNNIFEIGGHTYYGTGRDGNMVSGTEYVYYGRYSDVNSIIITFYDIQNSGGIIYFDGASTKNHYFISQTVTGLSNGYSTQKNVKHKRVTDYGRGNVETQGFKEAYFGIGSSLRTITGLPFWNTQFDPSIHNALSGAGVWGQITSNKEWTGTNIELSDICRYPKDTLKTSAGLAFIQCLDSPSEENPIEILIDISNRPISSYDGFWIQFDHRYIAEDYEISFDKTNNGICDYLAISLKGNDNPVSYSCNYQVSNYLIYRIKIKITKALQIPELSYKDAAYNDYIINYNPEGLIGIVNIGMPSNEAYGRAFLGECGGNVYGDLTLNKNSTIKNVPTPIEDGDAVNKAYVDSNTPQISQFDTSSGFGGAELVIGDYTIIFKGDNNVGGAGIVIKQNSTNKAFQISC